MKCKQERETDSAWREAIKEEVMSVQEHIHKLRREYSGEGLDATTVDPDPARQFEKWMETAVRAGLPDPHAMVVATVSPSGKPSARVVLLRQFNRDGFVFFTNYQSRKGEEILRNSNVAGVFFWDKLDRQVRIEGIAEELSRGESDAYFQSRPRDSQIATWASRQSEVISGRVELEERFTEFEKQFDGQAVPRPENWGGLRIKPESYEFWQGRPSRLHDRILYAKDGRGGWRISRLAP